MNEVEDGQRKTHKPPRERDSQTRDRDARVVGRQRCPSPPTDRSITGNTHAAVAASMPPRNAHDPRNAWRSRRRRRPSPTAMQPAEREERSKPRQRPTRQRGEQIGVDELGSAPSASGHRTATAAYSHIAALRLRACTAPSVFQARKCAPWPPSASSAKTPTRTCTSRGCRRVACAVKSVNSASAELVRRGRAAGRAAGCRARRRTAPAAARCRQQKTKSHAARQSGSRRGCGTRSRCRAG